MNLKRAAIVASVTIASLAGTAWASASTAVDAAGQYGNPARYTAFWRQQSTGDCVERSALLAMSAIQGSWVASTSGIDAEAVKLGILNANDDGSTFGITLPKLFAHYGFHASMPTSISRATVEADLAKGDSVEVTVYAGDLWDGVTTSAGTWEDPNATPTPDHAVVIEAINKTTNAVTIGDQGVPWGNGSTYSWSQFAAAWSVGHYDAVVISK